MDETTRQLVEQLRQFSTPELCDGCAERRVMDYHIKPCISEKRIVGPALTVDVPEDDGGFIPTAIEALEAGQVLVIAGKGFAYSSYWGDHRSLCAQMKGAEGVVIDGLFRDLEGCRDIGLPISARRGPGGGFRLDAPSAVAPVRLTPGEIAALIASVASVGPDISATARSALTRLLEALQPQRP